MVCLRTYEAAVEDPVNSFDFTLKQLLTVSDRHVSVFAPAHLEAEGDLVAILPRLLVNFAEMRQAVTCTYSARIRYGRHGLCMKSTREW
jgi:hypothetical protein